MSRTFFLGDPHFGHRSTWAKFTKKVDGSPLRPFTSTEQMNNVMIECWNSVVNNDDVVYLLGDVAMNKKDVLWLKHLKGRIVVIGGNHDTHPTKLYLECGVTRIAGSKTFNDFIATHIPIHPSCVKRFKVNVHGHLHDGDLDDPRYICLSTERINFTPVTYESVVDMIRAKQERFSMSPTLSQQGN